jgi:uncharacterized protein (TIGR02646 family)
MKRFERASEPDVLATNWETWGREWQQRRLTTPGAAFNWHQHNGQQVNHTILPALKLQVQDHCSFCDHFPVSPPSDDTIEHFQPKADFPLDAFKWTNLYYCCRFCQKKEGPFSSSVLRPDEPDYDFDRYFFWDFTQGTIEVNKDASPEDQTSAEATRTYFRLNEGHPTLRKMQFHRRMKCLDDPLDDFPYRNYLGGTPAANPHAARLA